MGVPLVRLHQANGANELPGAAALVRMHTSSSAYGAHLPKGNSPNRTPAAETPELRLYRTARPAAKRHVATGVARAGADDLRARVLQRPLGPRSSAGSVCEAHPGGDPSIRRSGGVGQRTGRRPHTPGPSALGSGPRPSRGDRYLRMVAGLARDRGQMPASL